VLLCLSNAGMYSIIIVQYAAKRILGIESCISLKMENLVSHKIASAAQNVMASYWAGKIYIYLSSVSAYLCPDSSTNLNLDFGSDRFLQ